MTSPRMPTFLSLKVALVQIFCKCFGLTAVSLNVSSSLGINRVMTRSAGIAFALLMSVAFTTSANDEVTPKRGQYTFVDSDELRLVEVGGNQFSIPRRYFWGVFGATSGKARGLNLMVLLPDFLPYSSKLDSEFTDCLGWCRRLYFSIDQSVKPGHRQRFIKELSDWNSRAPLDVEAAKRSYSGLEYLSLISKRDTSEWGVFVDEGYYFSCGPVSKPKPSCTIHAAIDDNLEMRLSFSRDYLSQIPVMLQKARQFISKTSGRSK